MRSQEEIVLGPSAIGTLSARKVGLGLLFRPVRACSTFSETCRRARIDPFPVSNREENKIFGIHLIQFLCRPKVD